jgi:hypothetical protein
MSAGHRRRLARLETALKPPEAPTRWREITLWPDDPEPIFEPGESLIIHRMVYPPHYPDDPQCSCRGCLGK